MNYSNELSIAIPTYNRAEYLERSLEHHVPLAKEFGLYIYISDNNSTDHTERVIEKWIKEYSRLVFVKNESNIGAVKNVAKALMLAKSNYVWLAGDTYLIPKKGIKYIFDTLNKNYSMYVFNLGSKSVCEDKLYTNTDKVLSEISGVMSCIAASVYHKNIIDDTNFRYLESSYYPHTKMGLEYIANNKFSIAWVGSIAIEGFSVEREKKIAWFQSERVFEIGMTDWLSLIFSLPEEFSLEAKINGAKQFNQASELFGLLGMAQLRSLGMLNYKAYKEFKNEIKLSIDYPVGLVAFISIMPISAMKLLKKVYKVIKG